MKNKIKKLLCAWMASVLALISSGVFSIQISADTGDVVINETNFPDPELRKIIAEATYLSDPNNYYSEKLKVDANSDGIFSDAELQNLTELDINGENVTDLTGLNLLKYLIHLNVIRTPITTIQAPQLPSGLDTFYCFENLKLTSLDLSKSTELTLLLCYDNQLISLDVSKNTKLTQLYCYNNQLTSLDVSPNIELVGLDCGNNHLTSLDLSKNTKLSFNPFYFNCSGNVYPIGKDTTSYDLSKLPNFELSKASGWTGATYDKATNTISNFTSDKITYTYDFGTDSWGNKKSETFTLSLTDPTTPDNPDNPDNPNPPVDPDNPNPDNPDNPNPDIPNPPTPSEDKKDELKPVSPESSYDYGYIWANGKDIKDDKKTSNVNEEKRYKTWVTEIGKMSLGGKWNVLVTDESINRLVPFLNLFTDGKLNATGKSMLKNSKLMASAKIKDGTITVTAGKKPGKVNVWIYEVKNKKVVVDEDWGVSPEFIKAEVLLAPANLCFAEVGDIEKGVLSSGKKAVTKVTVPYKVGATQQDEVSIAFGDKKAAYNPDAGFKLENSDKSVAEAWFFDQNTIKILPAKVGKMKLTLKNIQSSKTAKLNITVANYYKVTFPAGVTVSYKSGKDTKTIKSGDYVPDKAKLTISGSGTIKVNGSDIKKGKYTVSGKAVEITVPAPETTASAS